MTFIEKIFDKAKQNKKEILLVETGDLRVLKAAAYLAKEGIVKPVLLGDPAEIKQLAQENDLDLSAAKLISMEPAKQEEFAKDYYELRKHKGLSKEEAKKAMQEPIYYGASMLNKGYVDGLVAGAVYSTAAVLSPALRIVRTREDVDLVSTFTLMDLADKDLDLVSGDILAFADCSMVENPTAEQLSEIALSTAKSFEALCGVEAKVAMLSYSTKGSAKSASTEKVRKATKLSQEKNKDLLIDGEMQADAALDKDIAARKLDSSKVAGQANVLIFPDINAANISYKLVQMLAKTNAYGPITQGLRKPINDVSRGASVEDIIGVVALTAVQAALD